MNYSFKCPCCKKVESVSLSVSEYEKILTNAVGGKRCFDCQVEMQRVYNVVPVVYKGNGFYSIDNKKEKV